MIHPASFACVVLCNTDMTDLPSGMGGSVNRVAAGHAASHSRAWLASSHSGYVHGDDPWCGVPLEAPPDARVLDDPISGHQEELICMAVSRMSRPARRVRPEAVFLAGMSLLRAKVNL
jgi:hypothetical protein